MHSSLSGFVPSVLFCMGKFLHFMLLYKTCFTERINLSVHYYHSQQPIDYKVLNQSRHKQFMTPLMRWYHIITFKKKKKKTTSKPTKLNSDRNPIDKHLVIEIWMRANGFNRARSMAFNETDCSILFLLSSWLWYFHSGAANINSLWLILLECCNLPKKC